MISVKCNDKIISIDLMRVICAYMVVAIHVHPFEDINHNLGYIFTQIIPRIAVPFFFVVSGYFFTKSLIKDNEVTMRYLKRLIKIYTLWSIVYFLLDMITDLVRGNIDILSMVKNNIVSYFILGSYYHLWYFPALIFCVIVVSILNKFKCINKLYKISIILYIIGVLGCSYNSIGINIPLLNKLYLFSQFTLIRRAVLMGLPFFMLGYFIYLKSNNIYKAENSTIIKRLILIIICFLTEIAIVNILRIQENIVISLFLYPLTGLIFSLCLKNPMNNMYKHCNLFKYVANLVYYSHPLVIFVISNIGKILGIGVSQTPLFLLTCIFITLISLIMYKKSLKVLVKIAA